MHGVDLVRTVVGIVGNVISGLLFLSPSPTFARIWKKKSTEEFHPYPYLSAVMNCLFWIFYGLPIVHPDSTLVITINAAGLALELIYLIIFFVFTTKKHRVIIGLVLLAEAVLLGIVATITLHARESIDVCWYYLLRVRDRYVRISSIDSLYETKSAEYMPPWICLANFLNGIVWFAYANLKTFDPYIATGNGIGAVLGLIQLLVFGYYTWVYPKWHPSDDSKLQNTFSPV